MPASPAPFFAGVHCKVVFIFDTGQCLIDVEKWSAKPNVTKANDGINGEIRDRLSRYVNYYELSFTCKQVDTTALNELLRDIDNDDAGVLPLSKSFGLLIFPPNGKRAAYSANGAVIDDWDWASGGRTERSSLTIPARAPTFVPSKVL